MFLELKWTPTGDVYSFGVTMFEVFTNASQLPFAELQDAKVAHMLADRSVDLPALLFFRSEVLPPPRM